MDIIVCGAQKVFMHGGAELHQENLVAAFREAGHRCELVRLPVAWEKGRLFDSPMAWRLTPLDADLVVATNFPSYYARHDNKTVWLFHQHRGAYDGADTQADWSDFGLDDDSLERQRLLTEWDNQALGEARKIWTTSNVVGDRLRRYNGLESEALYHPPPMADQLRPGGYGDYILTATRFESNKRPQLMVEALAKTKTPVRAVGAGRGDLLADCQRMAEKLEVTKRIELPGFVPDAELLDLYSGALAVLYAPLDEDYGYVTLQAFYAAKAVVTASDSGGVLEWVEDGVTGLVTDGSPEALADAFDRLHSDKELARRMGEAGRERVRDLNWHGVVDKLLAP